MISVFVAELSAIFSNAAFIIWNQVGYWIRIGYSNQLFVKLVIPLEIGCSEDMMK